MPYGPLLQPGLPDRRLAGAPVELKLYPGVGHIDLVAALSGLLRGRAPTRADVLAYIDAH